MNRTRHIWLVIAFAITFIAWGCTTDSVQPTINLDDPYGCLGMVAENPDTFGAETFQSPLCGTEEGEEQEDPDVAGDPGYQDADNDPAARKFFLRIDWGQLRYNPDCPVWTVWDGSVTVSQGFVRLFRKFAWDRHDFIIRPRESKNTLAWSSRTMPHRDGILVKIVVPADAENVTVTFETAPYQRTFTLDELVKIYDRTSVDEYENMVSFIGFEKPVVVEAAGYIAGKWNRGKFRGRWISATGEIKGIVAGAYGIRKDRKKVFIGKYVDTQGNFKGIVRGVWGYGIPAIPGGYIAGHWIDASGTIAGYIGGHWVDSPNKHGGYMHCFYTKRNIGDPDDRDDEDKNAFPEP